MYQRILVPIDGSPTSDAGVAEAIALAKLTGGRLRFLHYLDPMPFFAGLDGAAAIGADAVAVMRADAEKLLQRARDDLGDPEFGQLGHAIAVQQDIRRLDVAVDDTLGVGVSQGLADLLGEPDRPRGAHHRAPRGRSVRGSWGRVPDAAATP